VEPGPRNNFPCLASQREIRHEHFHAVIHRPVGTTLLMVALGLSGAIAYTLLPMSPLPQVDFPTLT